MPTNRIPPPLSQKPPQPPPKGSATRRATLIGLGAGLLPPGAGRVGPAGAHCTKSGPCPCEAPCLWGQQALDDIERLGWPAQPDAAVDPAVVLFQRYRAIEAIQE